MRQAFAQPVVCFLSLFALCGCASRPVNPRITQTHESTGYRFETRQVHSQDRDNLVILAFSGGGTRAAAFSYGVLEYLRRTQVTGPDGRTMSLIDDVQVITGVSGGSFTALAYGLYGDALFDSYEKQFLKRDIQGEMVGRVLNPLHWPALWSRSWGRSEMAAKLYDEVLFHGATFADLDRGTGPFIVVSATDITNGSRIPFHQEMFDLLCSDLGAVRLSRAAAASSAVPVALSPVTLNNYGGTCNFTPPDWLEPFLQLDNPPRPAARAMRERNIISQYKDSVHRPYIHLVDGGVSDNLGLRGVLDALEVFEALHDSGKLTPFEYVKRVVVFIVNSLSTPPTDWDKHESAPHTVSVLVKAAGVPIDHYSYEAVELLKDTEARWQVLRQLRDSGAYTSGHDPALDKMLRAPSPNIYAIDVSFARLENKDEFEYLNKQPTSFSLPGEAVDRLRAAAGGIIEESPEFQRFLKDAGYTIVQGAPPAAVPTH
jgi:NTE family protein